jgi:hypothetical protein
MVISFYPIQQGLYSNYTTWCCERMWKASNEELLHVCARMLVVVTVRRKSSIFRAGHSVFFSKLRFGFLVLKSSVFQTLETDRFCRK